MKRKYSAKLFIVYVLLLVWAFIVIVRMFSLVIGKGEAYRGNFQDTLTIDDRFFRLDSSRLCGFRGNVYSDGGELLSTTIPIYDLYWEVAQVGLSAEDSAFYMSRVDSLISIFCRLTPKRSREFYEERMKDGYLNYYTLCKKQQNILKHYKDKKIKKEAKARLAFLKDSVKNDRLIVKISVDELPKTWVRRYDWDAIRFLFLRKEGEAERTYYGGCRVDERYVHHNVYDDYAASVIGSMGENKRYGGIEGYYDSLLSGEKHIYRRLYVNRVSIPLRENQLMQIKNGCDLSTTINVDMQRVVEQSLRTQLERLESPWGCAILMEVKTGEIKAISSLTRTDEGYKDYVDHAIQENVEPGSTFKLISLIAALESRKIDTGDIVQCEKGPHTLKWAFEYSDNKGLYEAAKTGYNTLDQFFMRIRQMGLDSNLGIEVVNANKPMVTTQTRNDNDYSHVTHGYALKMAPIYVAAYYNAVANNGRYMRPYLVKSVTYPDGRRVEHHPVVIKDRICSPLTLAKVQACLEGVVTNGTAKRAQDNYYRMHKNDTGRTVRPLIAGKTGTAQIFEKGKGYTKRYNASFACYFPSDRPQYTCLVLISGSSNDAGVVAAPVCREIAEKIISRDLSMQHYVYRGAQWDRYPKTALGYAPDLALLYHRLGYRLHYSTTERWVSVQPVNGEDNRLTTKAKSKNDLYALLKGATAKDALYLLEKKGYRVRLHGVGKVGEIRFSAQTADVYLTNDN